jgi:hypothetical protein
LYEILKSRDGTTGMGVETDITAQHISLHNDDTKKKCLFGLFRSDNKFNSGDDEVCKPNYDSDDSDAKLNDWDC